MTCAMILRLILYFVLLRYLLMEDDKPGGFLKPVNTLNVSHCKWSFLNFNLWSLWIAKGVIIVQRFAKSYILNIVGPIKLWKTTFKQFYVHWCCYKANNNGPTWVHGTIAIFHGPWPFTIVFLFHKIPGHTVLKGPWVKSNLYLIF